MGRRSLSFRTLEAVETYHRNVAERTRDLLGSMTRKALDQEFVLEGNPELKSAMKDILMHSFVDEMAHLGELDCLFWQMDVDPDWLSWLDVHRTTERRRLRGDFRASAPAPDPVHVPSRRWGLSRREMEAHSNKGPPSS